MIPQEIIKFHVTRQKKDISNRYGQTDKTRIEYFIYMGLNVITSRSIVVTKCRLSLLVNLIFVLIFWQSVIYLEDVANDL
jgi:hypothetical protein